MLKLLEHTVNMIKRLKGWNRFLEKVTMQYDNKKLLGALLLVFSLASVGMDGAVAATEVLNSDAVQTFAQWPMTVWYGFSAVLALIGFIKAKS